MKLIHDVKPTLLTLAFWKIAGVLKQERLAGL